MKFTARLICVFSVLTLACQSLFAANGPAAPFVDVQSWTKENGAKIYFVERRSLPMVDIAVLFPAGAVYDGKHQGIAYLTNAILNEGAGKFNANKLADQFAEVGAVYACNIDRDNSIFTLRTLSDEKSLNASLSTFATVLTMPTFPIDAIARVKKEMDAAYRSELQDPSSIATNALYKAIYRHFPYGHNVLGTHDSRSKITRDDLLQFYKNHYTSNHAIVIIVGDVSKEKAKAIGKHITDFLPKNAALAPLHLPTMEHSKKEIHINYPSLQTTIMMGQVGISRKDKALFPLLVGNAVLGGLPLSSQLFVHVREKNGLAYYASSQFNLLKYDGPFIVSLQTRADNATKALSLVNSVVGDFLKNGPTEKQLALAKQNLVGRFPLEIATNASILSFIASTSSSVDPAAYLNEYVDHISSVTVSEVKSAFQKKVKLNQMVTVTVGPES